ncbi:MAG: SH3 domain-containing protein [Bacteroidia bacterium]|nr:SH3 domain-containing protein [Bacteroidia bacterium]
MTGKTFFSSVLGKVGIFLGLLLLLLLTSCNQGRATEGEIVTEGEVPVVPKDTLPLHKSAVCVWTPYASLRQEPGRKTYTKDGEDNWITSIRYGEVVELLDSTVRIKKDRRDYMKVKLKDGKEGWVQEYLFEKYAKPAVVLQKTYLYRRPDQMTLRDDFLDPGEIIVLIQDPTKPGGKSWYHVSSRRKIKKGWIHQPKHISTSTRDVKAALLLYKAVTTKSTDKKLERLRSILQIPGIDEKSPLYAMVQGKIKETENEDIQNELFKPGSKLFITENDTWMHSNPDMGMGNANQMKQLTKDDICLILDIGERDSLGAFYDFWYRVQYGDAEGWVYGHYTSRRYLD